MAPLCCGAGCSDETVTIPIVAPLASAATLNPDQQVYQTVELQGGELMLNFGGGTLTAQNNNHLYSVSSGGLAQSPLTAGPQTQTLVQTNLDGNLTLPSLSLTWVVQAGQVWLVPSPEMQRISYVGDRVRVDVLAQGGETILESYELYDFSVTALSGAIAKSPPELLAALPLDEWISYGNFLANATWQPGAEYIKRQVRRVGDIVFAENCANHDPIPSDPTTNLPVSCATAVSLTRGFFPISMLSTKDHPTETDFLSDGTIINWQGITMWVARRPLPREQSVTENYRVFFEWGGNIYLGTLQRSGTPFRYAQFNGGRVPYQVVYNQAAVKSVQAGLATGSVAAGSEDLNPPAPVPTLDLFHIGGHGINGSLSPADLRTHYNVPATLTGAGQTIAIVDAPTKSPVADDLNVFSDYFGLPECNTANPCFRLINLSQNSPYNEGDEVELDVQMVHAMAPAATIILVIAASNSHADLLTAVNRAEAIPGVTAVSLSYTFSVSNTNTTAISIADAQSEDQQLAAGQNTSGITLFASSGDDGHLPNATYPAASPYVTAVGGTQVRSVNWRWDAFSDVAWEFSGGGPSVYATMPAWQSAYVSPAVFAANNGMRAVPDVAAVADPGHSAVAVYYEGAWDMAGGTSVATPIWAGIAALIGESLAQHGQSLTSLVKETPGGFNGLLYQAKLNVASLGPFRDILVGTNNLTTSPCGVCTAGAGYNDITGLGVPDVANLLSLF